MTGVTVYPSHNRRHHVLPGSLQRLIVAPERSYGFAGGACSMT